MTDNIEDILSSSKAVRTRLNHLWWFARKRHYIFTQRRSGCEPPWTDIPALATGSFTNVWRWLDRTSQDLLRLVIHPEYDAADTFFRVILFDVFKRTSTWERLTAELGDLTLATWNRSAVDGVLTAMRDRGEQIFTSAYMSTGVATERSGVVCRSAVKHRNWLTVLDAWVNSLLPELAWKMSPQELTARFCEYPMMGTFLAQQFLCDLGYTRHATWDESECVLLGPGSRRGLTRLVGDLLPTTDEVLGLVLTALWLDSMNSPSLMPQMTLKSLGIQHERAARVRVIPSLMDFQNVVCEWDKFCRVSDVPGLAPVPGRKMQVKRRFDPARAVPCLGVPLKPFQFTVVDREQDTLEVWRPTP